ncbi:TPA: patatin-like phospholipase family protein [Pseudomonas aeruginosa]|uniref:patatin-like phospholipase family protein n=1 Tax=Pseudomonas aeruginosa TaxID=287 RepID=UPI0005BE6FCA|nr:patatin-like phospholipase family protein [Pseudomonas aeruginosa]MBI7363653.1 patatin-like phospholipase family protein [Pseudomonas aeruginosa]NPS70488.1 patatin-like phospholipase family protein [Pseudomonas aeruginosa]PQM13769.1 phospholipase [Pseudomonas aeruginosa]TEE59154.1 patatin-like phospholipase family protein [Pseudomonas aeruginosa]HBO4120487.1 patatin-like phospholipase family protein [Pseudomonas aeruginosa]
MAESMKVGLVLSGGGAKGAYQVGVLKALRELGTRIDAVSGASIGALNGGVLASAPSLDVAIERLEELWGRLAKQSPLNMKVPGYLMMLAAAGLRLQGAGTALAGLHAAQSIARRLNYELPEWLEFLEDSLLDDQPLRELMDEYLVSDDLDTGLPLYVSIYKSNGGLTDLLSAFKAELGFIDTPDSDFVHIQSMEPAERKKLLLASAAIPMLFKPRTIEGQRYTDGGQGGWQTMQGNTPITPLIDAGCNLVIVTHLSDGSPWSRHDFPDATILEIRPSESLNRAQGPLGGARDLLGFDAEKIPSWIEQGYRDTLACVGRVMDAQKSRNELRVSEAALGTLDQQGAQADEALADAMARLK